MICEKQNKTMNGALNVQIKLKGASLIEENMIEIIMTLTISKSKQKLQLFLKLIKCCLLMVFCEHFISVILFSNKTNINWK